MAACCCKVFIPVMARAEFTVLRSTIGAAGASATMGAIPAIMVPTLVVLNALLTAANAGFGPLLDTGGAPEGTAAPGTFRACPGGVLTPGGPLAGFWGAMGLAEGGALTAGLMELGLTETGPLPVVGTSVRLRSGAASRLTPLVFCEFAPPVTLEELPGGPLEPPPLPPPPPALSST